MCGVYGGWRCSRRSSSTWLACVEEGSLRGKNIGKMVAELAFGKMLDVLNWGHGAKTLCIAYFLYRWLKRFQGTSTTRSKLSSWSDSCQEVSPISLITWYRCWLVFRHAGQEEDDAFAGIFGETYLTNYVYLRVPHCLAECWPLEH